MLIAGDNITIKDYLYLKQMTVEDFSKLIGYTRHHVSGVINGRFKPTKKFALYIEKVTDGMVKAKDLIEQYEKTDAINIK